MAHKIFFNVEEHRYYDEFNNPFVSVTQNLSKYIHQFDTEAMALACYKSGLRGNVKYRGKTLADIKSEWKKRNLDSLKKGTEDHDYLEDVVKGTGRYYRVKKKLQSNQLYTIEDVLEDKSLGVLDLNSPQMQELKVVYPLIYYTFELLMEHGYRILSEVAVFSLKYLISGLIDILVLKDSEFKIIDWKTNNDTIMFTAGYWEHDVNYVATNYKATFQKLKYPLVELDQSVGIEYSIQLSTYAHILESFGLKNTGMLLYHIRKFNYSDSDAILDEMPQLRGKRQLDKYKIMYLKEQVTRMLEHQLSERKTDLGHKLMFGV